MLQGIESGATTTTTSAPSVATTKPATAEKKPAAAEEKKPAAEEKKPAAEKKPTDSKTTVGSSDKKPATTKTSEKANEKPPADAASGPGSSSFGNKAGAVIQSAKKQGVGWGAFEFVAVGSIIGVGMTYYVRKRRTDQHSYKGLAQE